MIESWTFDFFTQPSTSLLCALLILCFFLSSFFSAAETALLSLNRYRLRHSAQESKTAQLLLALLERPDRLLGALLIGNTACNSIATVLWTFLVMRYLGDNWLLAASAVFTLALLVLVEVAPKTGSALYPEKMSRLFARPLTLLLTIMHPLIVSVNFLSNNFLKLFGVRLDEQKTESLSGEELRMLVRDTVPLTHKDRSMLLGILDLQHISLSDLMIARNEISGINITQPWEDILEKIAHTQHSFLPVYRDDIDQVIGILHIKNALHVLMEPECTLEQLLTVVNEPYFIPLNVSLSDQLLHFQQQLLRIALVVDEYGNIQGMITLEDILEEFVGQYTTDAASLHQHIHPQSDGSFFIDGCAHLRTLNRLMNWHLPTPKGIRTLSGLIIHYLETIPESGTCVLIARYPIEVISLKDNTIKTARLSARLEKKEEPL